MRDELLDELNLFKEGYNRVIAEDTLPPTNSYRFYNKVPEMLEKAIERIRSQSAQIEAQSHAVGQLGENLKRAERCLDLALQNLAD